MYFFKVFSLLLFIYSITCAYANEFTLNYSQDGAYYLVVPSVPEFKVVVELNGANELLLSDIINTTCFGVHYVVPVINSHIDNALVNAEHIEYFIFQKEGAKYKPVKSYNSFDVVDRNTGEKIQNHSLIKSSSYFNASFCSVVTTELDLDSEMYIIKDE